MQATRVAHPLRHNFRTVLSDALRTNLTVMPPSLAFPPPLSQKLSFALDSGKLLDDTLVHRVVQQRLAQPDCMFKGCILDGFPRTVAQTQQLMNGSWRPEVIVELTADSDHLRTRLLKRAKHSARKDDTAIVIERRLQQYHTTCHLIRHQIAEAGVPFFSVHAAEHSAVHQVFESLLSVVGNSKNVLMMGAPGCGKGTQSALLSRVNGAVHVSSGDLLRGLRQIASL